MPSLLKPFLRLVLPLLVLLLSIFLLGKTGQLNANYLKLSGLLPYGILVVALGLSHYFNRSRFFAATLLLAGTFWLIQNHLQNSLTDPSTFYIYSSISLLVPLALLLLTALPERGLWNTYGLLSLSIPVLLLATAFVFHSFSEPSGHKILSENFSTKPFQGYVLSVNASVWFLLHLLCGLLLLAHRDTEAEASLCACLLFVFATLAFFDQPLISIVMFSAAGIALVIGLLRSSFEMAYRDDLTGLLGRRAFNEKLKGLGRNYAIAMMDVDHFKKFNDTHGHDVGDDVLKIVARHIANVTGGGTAYRYGGEEFAIIFPGKKLKPCIPHLESVREAIADYEITLRDQKNRPKNTKEGAFKRGKHNPQKSVSVTISIGLAEKTETLSKPEQVLKAADNALYKSKQNGRNCLSY
jgi:diguanylate cyclase (GGDEF)-like protein